MPAFAGLCASLAADAAAWQAWMSDTVEAEMPGGWGARLTAFQHLLVVKVCPSCVDGVLVCAARRDRPS